MGSNTWWTAASTQCVLGAGVSLLQWLLRVADSVGCASLALALALALATLITHQPKLLHLSAWGIFICSAARVADEDVAIGVVRGAVLQACAVYCRS
jgi:hypothetical protein